MIFLYPIFKSIMLFVIPGRMKSLLFQMAKQTNALEKFTVNQVTEQESHAVIRKCCDLNELHELEENLQKTVYVAAMVSI